jgi:hypothetical protein
MFEEHRVLFLSQFLRLIRVLKIEPSIRCRKLPNILIVSWQKGKRLPFIFNDKNTGSCICLRLDLYLPHVTIGARHLGSLCSILPFIHKKYPRQETVTYVASCIQGMFLAVPTFVAKCHYVRKDARDPDGKIWNCEREGWPIKGVT